jgi:hypothetical protein
MPTRLSFKHKIAVDANNYGGMGEFILPDDHKAGMVVPKGGSSCANCRFASTDGKHCLNVYWVEWNGGNPAIPAPADEYCSDWYEPNPAKLAQ